MDPIGDQNDIQCLSMYGVYMAYLVVYLQENDTYLIYASKKRKYKYM